MELRVVQTVKSDPLKIYYR